MNGAFELSWRKGVAGSLIVALLLSLYAITPLVYAEEAEGGVVTDSALEEDSSVDFEEEDTQTEEETTSLDEDLSIQSASLESDEETEEDSGANEGEEGREVSGHLGGEETPSSPPDADETDESEATSTESVTTSTSSPSTVSGNEPAETTTGSQSESGSSASLNEEDTVDIVSIATSSTTDSESSPDEGDNNTIAATTVLTSTTTAEVASTTAWGATTTEATSSAQATIESGTAVALANIINIVNSNFINSDGVVFFANFLEAISEALDLRRLYDSISQVGCSLVSCEGDSTTVNISNMAAIQNYLMLQAMTGGNLLSGTDGSINTGDAYAGLNLINVANMNFVDSNYLLVTLNAFNDVNNDIIFPSTDLLLSSLAYSPDSAHLNLTNDAIVNNNVDVEADTGNNVLEAENGMISTGTSGATTNVFNQINSSLIGGQNITILFRIHGNWVGDVFGAPDDLLWQQGPDGSILLFDSNSGSGSNNSGSLDLTASNNASIDNNVSVVALTGENKITGAETGLISTGNAYAGANIVNLANGNVVGRNWVLAIINIFGDFHGNISFGRPDLWVGEMVDAPNKIKNGSTLTYKYTVINNGDSPATNVVLEDAYEGGYLKIVNSSLPYTTAGGKLRFELGKIPRGGAVEVSYQAEVFGTREGQELTNVVTVKGKETDNNLKDNTDTATVETYRSSGSATRKDREIVREVKETPLLSGVMADELSTLRVKRVFKNFPLTAEYPTMRQVVVLHNPTNTPIPQVTFEDVLKDPSGSVLKVESWELGDVLPGEEIELGYTLAFEPTAPAGTYTLHSRVKTGAGGEDTHQNGTIIFTTGLMPEMLPSFLNDLKVAAPSLTSVLPGFASSLTDMDADTLNSLSVLFDEEGMVLPTLAGHSMSTATRQLDMGGEGWSGWLARLYAYLSSLLSKVAPTIALAWGGGRDL